MTYPDVQATAVPEPEELEPGALAALSEPDFLARQRVLLLAEQAEQAAQLDGLLLEAETLARESEPGDTQFDEESGEGGTATVERERNLTLAAQARAALLETEAALQRLAAGTYGRCESCQEPIGRARLQVIPSARLCVACKSGGLSRR